MECAMSKLIQGQELEVQEVYDTDLEEGDYCFVLGPDGKLKSVIFPEALPFNSPKNVKKILKLFGIHDPEKFNDSTLH